jgi:hypothetical protein
VARNGKKNRDDEIITALAAGGNIASAARHAGVSERTVRRRLADPAFARKVDEARTEMVRAVVGRLAATGVLAVTRLQDLVDNARSEAVRLGAARAILEHMFKGAEVEVLAREVDALKRQFEEVQRGISVSEGGRPAPPHWGQGPAPGVHGE